MIEGWQVLQASVTCPRVRGVRGHMIMARRPAYSKEHRHSPIQVTAMATLTNQRPLSTTNSEKVRESVASCSHVVMLHRVVGRSASRSFGEWLPCSAASPPHIEHGRTQASLSSYRPLLHGGFMATPCCNGRYGGEGPPLVSPFINANHTLSHVRPRTPSTMKDLYFSHVL